MRWCFIRATVFGIGALGRPVAITLDTPGRPDEGGFAWVSQLLPKDHKSRLENDCMSHLFVKPLLGVRKDKSYDSPGRFTVVLLLDWISVWFGAWYNGVGYPQAVKDVVDSNQPCYTVVLLQGNRCPSRTMMNNGSVRERSLACSLGWQIRATNGFEAFSSLYCMWHPFKIWRKRRNYQATKSTV